MKFSLIRYPLSMKKCLEVSWLTRNRCGENVFDTLHTHNFHKLYFSFSASWFSRYSKSVTKAIGWHSWTILGINVSWYED